MGDNAQPSASERALEAARFSLSRLVPEYSARRRLTFVQGAVIVAALLTLIACWQLNPALTSTVLCTVAFGLFALLTLWRLAAAADALAAHPESDTRAELPHAGPLPVYTILCPLYREARVLPDLARRLSRLSYPADKLDVKIVLEADDVETIQAANAISWPAHVELIVTPAGKPRTKPKALNYALTFARGAFVTVYDAEDAPEPGQLHAALDAFAADPELGCVQAPLLFDNGRAGWLAAQFATEYAVQFGEILPLLARLKLPLMLGGTSNHFRTSALIGAGGWDPFNVTEDADIGYRLAREGWRIGMIAPPTWEEAPAKLNAWIVQRTRWIKGHIQTWLVLMRDPGRTLKELGLAGFIAMQFMLGGAVMASCLHGPILGVLGVALFTRAFDPGWHGWALAIFGYVVAAYNVLVAAIRTRDARMALTALTMPFYWPLSTIAAANALIQLVFKPHYWAKTEHGLTARGARAVWRPGRRPFALEGPRSPPNHARRGTSPNGLIRGGTMNSLMKAAALAAALFAFAETASAETVTCPLPNARREITNTLPSGWWTTPIVSPLSETKLQTIGGKQTLMCVYGPSGSVQRDAPANSTCTAQTGGFDCKVNLVIKPGVLGHLGGLKVQPINPGTYKTAALNVRQTFSFDLDEGVELGVNPAADLWFQAETASLLYIAPRNGATMWTGDRSNRNYEGCAGAGSHYTADRVSLSDLPVGSYVCVKTNGGRISQYRINALSAGSPKTLTIGFTTWNK